MTTKASIDTGYVYIDMKMYAMNVSVTVTEAGVANAREMTFTLMWSDAEFISDVLGCYAKRLKEDRI